MVKIAYHPIYMHPLPEGHRFPMLKYDLIPEQLLYEGTIEPGQLFAPAYCAESTILTTHTAVYWQQLIQGSLTPQQQRRIGFPHSATLVHREQMIVQGTIDCCLCALDNGVALNVAGGTHHAFADRGEGFCLLNDMAIAANYLLQQQLAKKILIIDLDVHQGNGTASIFSNQPNVYTFSMHGAHNYPFVKEQSDTDIGLPDGTDTNTYLQKLSETLPPILSNFQPDFAFYLSGVDILDTDKFGKLKVTLDGCKKRDEFVFNQLQQRNIPVAVAMGGGYSADIKTIVNAHCNTFRVAMDLYS